VILLAALAALLLISCGRSPPTTPARALDPDPVISPRPTPDGGAAACLPEGEEGPPPEVVPQRPCCEGLGRVPIYKWSFVRVDECLAEKGGRYLCIKCGDGRCGIGENRCNCPADCRW